MFGLSGNLCHKHWSLGAMKHVALQMFRDFSPPSKCTNRRHVPNISPAGCSLAVYIGRYQHMLILCCSIFFSGKYHAMLRAQHQTLSLILPGLRLEGLRDLRDFSFEQQQSLRFRTKQQQCSRSFVPKNPPRRSPYAKPHPNNHQPTVPTSVRGSKTSLKLRKPLNPQQLKKAALLSVFAKLPSILDMITHFETSAQGSKKIVRGNSDTERYHVQNSSTETVLCSGLHLPQLPLS